MSFVVTLTFNPAMDLCVGTEQVVSTRKLRCSTPRYDPGGGGINVARVIGNLGSKALAVYPAGGPFGQLLQRSLDELGVLHRAVPIAGDTRESITVDEASSGLQYRFVLPGPSLSRVELDRCLESVAMLDPPPAYLVVSGSLPPGVPLTFYDELRALAERLEARLVVDFSGPMLAHAAQRGGAFLMKPSLTELSGLMGRALNDPQEQVAALRELLAAGAAEVIVLSLGAQGALFGCGQQLERLPAPPVPVRSAVGAGDSMVGAIVHALLAGHDLAQAVRWGVAAGAATVMRPGTELCRREDVEALLAGGRS